MDLEKFPISAAANRMLAKVSGGFYDRSYVGKWLYEVMGQELDDARRLYEELPLQVLAETATWGLSYHEQMYSIPPAPKRSLEERRAEVLRRRDFRAPMNPARIEEIVKGIVNDIAGIKIMVKENAAPYTFEISFIREEYSSSPDYAAVRKRIREAKPSHIAYYISEYYESMIPVAIFYGNQIVIRSFLYQQQAHDLFAMCLFMKTELGYKVQCKDYLTVEKDLWCLDGSNSLDGARRLDAQIIVYEEE